MSKVSTRSLTKTTFSVSILGTRIYFLITKNLFLKKLSKSLPSIYRLIFLFSTLFTVMENPRSLYTTGNIVFVIQRFAPSAYLFLSDLRQINRALLRFVALDVSKVFEQVWYTVLNKCPS